DRHAKSLRELHQPERLAVALRVRHAEAAEQILFRVAALLLADHHHRLAVEERGTADERGIVGEMTVAVQLGPVAERALDVVERKRPLRMTRELHALIRR